MPQQQSIPVETVKAILDAFNAHDLDTIMEFFADDFSLDMPRGPDPWGQRFVGKAAMREGLATRFEGLPGVRFSDARHWISGNMAVSEWRLTGTRPEGDKDKVRGCDHTSFETGRLFERTRTGSYSRSHDDGSCLTTKKGRLDNPFRIHPPAESTFVPGGRVAPAR